MNFCAVDIETATTERTSACSIAIVVVRRGEIADRFFSFLRPASLDFSPRLTAIHGITPHDVVDAPGFAQIWPRVEGLLSGETLVAHNAPFDVGVIQRSLEACSLPCPGLRYACTLAMARQLLPGLPDHRLPTVAALFGIDCEHHSAASDAETCARLAILLGRLAGRKGIDEFVNYCSGPLPAAETVGPATDSTEKYGSECLDAVVSRTGTDSSRLSGLSFVFTGELSKMTREQAEHLVASHGGRTAKSVSRKTDFLVVGGLLLAAYRRVGHATEKLKDAELLSAAGAKVRIIDESEFIGISCAQER